MIYFNNASTAESKVVTRAITPDPRLEQRTELAVIVPDGRSYRKDVYRRSGAVKGSYSRDLYVWNGSEWKFVGKDSRKYGHDELPLAPPDAVESSVGGVRVWTRQPMDENERERLTRLISVLPLTGR